MLRMVSGKQARRLDTGRAYPPRRLHLVDIENLAGAPMPSPEQVREIQDCYAERLAIDVADHVVIASSHRGLLPAALGWPHARYRVRSGPDGADLELLDVVLHEDVAGRFTRVAIGSGDGFFARAAAYLAAAGVWVTVVSRRRSLSPRLARAADEVIFIDPPDPLCGPGPSRPRLAAA